MGKKYILSLTYICSNRPRAQIKPCGSTDFQKFLETHCTLNTKTFFALQGFGPNPNYGYTSYDNIMYAYLCAFRLMTQIFFGPNVFI